VYQEFTIVWITFEGDFRRVEAVVPRFEDGANRAIDVFVEAADL